MPLSAKITTTIEGPPAKVGKALQDAWVAEEVPQCGYQTGQMMSAAALISKNPNPSEAEIVGAMDGNVCRCGNYHRIQKAVVRAGKGCCWCQGLRRTMMSKQNPNPCCATNLNPPPDAAS